MHMKNTKAVFLIILGSFLLATGFAYAKEDGPTMQKLIEIAGDNTPAVDAMAAAGVKNMGNLTQTKSSPVNVKAALPEPTRSSGVVAPSVSSAPSPKVEEKKTFGKTVKEWVGKNFDNIVASAAIGFIGLLIIGTGIGGLLVGLAAFGFLKGMQSL